MLSPDEYELLDFGHGRKLERMGARILDRLSPAAEDELPADPRLWKQATLRYQRTRGDKGTWTPAAEASTPWQFRCFDLVLELKSNEFGHVGVFPEQADNWEWISRQVRRAGRPLRVLNLFAYTGVATLVAAAAGAQVTHVDAARNVVAWARRNAELSGLAEGPTRWIVEDACKFVRREVKRGNRYDAVILDPPTYGHGPKGEPWVLRDQLGDLLQLCAELTCDQRAFFLLTCHSPGFGPAELQAMLSTCLFGHCGPRIAARTLYLATAAGRRMNCGVAARWPAS